MKGLEWGECVWCILRFFFVLDSEAMIRALDIHHMLKVAYLVAA